ncbi:M23 family metallopeptidase [uncultured Treponema sp.]|uniref:M23 family metallopeptidase n=1 Tax=uncultured Treponema sp. TaxID=162155 RepID=UPI0025D53035|nr:M23 family metallopeptidase [uncultured Treponema sp.]MEE0353517.1 M23 family metallopeptidase [Treponema sp.]
MAHSRKYKRLEKNIVSRIMHAFRLFFVSIGKICTNVVKFFDGKLTLMIVPHSQGKVFSVQTNVFALVLGIILAIGITGSFVYFNQKNASSGLEISRLRDENRETLASLDELRDENNNLLQTAKKFQSTLSQSLSLLGINQNTGTSKSAGRNSDLSSLFDTQDITSGSLKETSDIKQLTAYLESAVRPVEQIGKMLENQGALFSDIPNVWPVKNGIGHISMEFGQNQHPITQQWYIHKGLDFSTWRQGDPVIATANGQVVTVTYDDSFGLYVIIKHKHGIYTRYAHLGTTRVKKGDTVAQRQIIGTIGNTGITTGPHLHYEVHIGSDVVDPAKYINVK